MKEKNTRWSEVGPKLQIQVNERKKKQDRLKLVQNFNLRSPSWSKISDPSIDLKRQKYKII
jgi:hypothetical protein